MQRIIFLLFLYLCLFSLNGQNPNYVKYNKNPMDTVVFVIDTTATSVSYDSSAVYFAYYDREFKKQSFEIRIKGIYLNNRPYKVDPDFQKIYLAHLLSDAVWFSVEHPVLNLKKSEIKRYKTYDDQYLANLEDISELTKVVGPIPWLEKAQCYLCLKSDVDSKSSTINLYRVGLFYSFIKD